MQRDFAARRGSAPNAGCPTPPSCRPTRSPAAPNCCCWPSPTPSSPGLVSGLAATSAVRPGTIVAHTSGANGIGVLAPLTEQGCIPLAIHPAMTFTGSDEDIARLPDTCFGVTAADEVGYAIAQSLVLEIGGEPFRVREDARTLYHAALAHASNHVVTVLLDAVEALRAALWGQELLGQEMVGDAPGGIAERVIGPLARASLENSLQRGQAALTGPVARGDAAAVAGHLRALAEVDPQLAQAYRANSLRTAQRAHAPKEVFAVFSDSGFGTTMTTPKPQFTAGDLNVYSSPRDVSDVTRALRATGRRVMLVPTMGALHEGHLALIRAAKRVQGAVVVVSIFVNPLQFGAGEDLDAYPRTLDDDLAALRAEGVEIAFTPTAADMYPDGTRTSVHPGPLGAELEGAARPTHFAGVLTVVLKLLQIVRPDRAFFGEKDYQQLVLVRQMVADLNVDTQIVGVPIVREADGLAMSSRNRYLDEVEREQAGALSAALLAGMYAASGGAAAALDAARAVLDEVPAIDVDYLEVRDAMLGPAPAEGIARMLVAARLGSTRLLDNIAIDIGATTGIDGHPRVGSDRTTNCLGGIDVTDNAEIEDPPRHGHSGRPALRRFGDHRRRPDGRGRPARGRAGHDRRHRQRRTAGHLRDHRRARQRCDRHQRRRSASRASR